MARGYARDGEDGPWLWVLVKKETEKAWLVYDGESDKWLPKSQILDEAEPLGEGAIVKIQIKTWIAEKNGFNTDNDQSDVVPKKNPLRHAASNDDERPPLPPVDDEKPF